MSDKDKKNHDPQLPEAEKPERIASVSAQAGEEVMQQVLETTDKVRSAMETRKEVTGNFPEDGDRDFPAELTAALALTDEKEKERVLADLARDASWKGDYETALEAYFVLRDVTGIHSRVVDRLLEDRIFNKLIEGGAIEKLLVEKQPERAAQALLRAEELKKVPSKWTDVGDGFMDTGDWRRAIDCYERAGNEDQLCAMMFSAITDGNKQKIFGAALEAFQRVHPGLSAKEIEKEITKRGRFAMEQKWHERWNSALFRTKPEEDR